MTVSLSAEETIEKAKVCYSLDLISEETMLRVIAQAERNPEYNPILDLPLDFEVAHERELRHAAAKKQRHGWRRWLPW